MIELLTANTPNGGTPGFLYSWREQSNPATEIGTGITYIYSKDGAINMPCPECTDEMYHIRNWKGQMFDG